jgi:hypothetical protein
MRGGWTSKSSVNQGRQLPVSLAIYPPASNAREYSFYIFPFFLTTLFLTTLFLTIISPYYPFSLLPSSLTRTLSLLEYFPLI